MKPLNCWLIANIEFAGAILFFFIISGNVDLLGLWDSGGDGFIIAAGIIALIPSICIGVYTWKNFNEVVSRRTLWRNSNTVMFEQKLIYSFQRFFMTLVTIGMFFWVIL